MSELSYHPPRRPRPSHKNKKSAPELSRDTEPTFLEKQLDHHPDRILEKMHPRELPLANGLRVTMSPELALTAYVRARLFENKSPTIKRKVTSTQGQYDLIVDMLRRNVDDGASEFPCPFEGFMEQDFFEDGKFAKSKFYRYKAALQSYAVSLLMKAGPGMLCSLSPDQDVDALATLITQEFNVDKNVGSPLPKKTNVDKGRPPHLRYANVDNLSIRDSMICFNECRDQVLKAAAFLEFYKPLKDEKATHLNRAKALARELEKKKAKDVEDSTLALMNRQARNYKRAFQAPGYFVYNSTFAEAHHEVNRRLADGQRIPDDLPDAIVLQSFRSDDFIDDLKVAKPQPIHPKSEVVSKLKKFDARLNDGLEWRQRFFLSIDDMNEEFQEDRKNQLAILSLTGCRPKELVYGVRVHVEDSPKYSPTVKLVFRIRGAKFTDCPEEEDALIYQTRSEKEKEYQEELYNNPSFRASLEKGNEWRYARIESTSPEAFWLRDYVMRNAEGRADAPENMENMTDAEKAAFASISEKMIVASLTIRPQIVDRNGVDVFNHNENHKVACGIGKWISYHACKVFPATVGNVSPYCWRHQFSSDVKLEDQDLSTRAQALGQSSQRTQSRYGSKRSGRTPTQGGKFHSISFRTSRPVRNNYSHPMGRSPAPQP